MRSSRIRQRAIRLTAIREAVELERWLGCLAARLGVSSEALRAEAVALHVDFADRGITTKAGKIAFVAEELGMPIAELRNAVEEAMNQCR